MTVRQMSLAELELIIGWAADEGWNPGLEDASAFYAVDPDGFFLKEVDGQAVAAVSVVNHSDDFAFLGLYLCRPEFRRRGHGLEVWRAGAARAGNRCIGLDGVPDQQANYVRSGFSRQGRTIRYPGMVERRPETVTRPASDRDLNAIYAQDTEANGVCRKAFSAAWFQRTKTRQTLLLGPDSATSAFATYRVCREGVKIGPLHAGASDQANALLASVPEPFGGGPIMIDVPESEVILVQLLEEMGFDSVFETARMYSTSPSCGSYPPYFSIASMELG